MSIHTHSCIRQTFSGIGAIFCPLLTGKCDPSHNLTAPRALADQNSETRLPASRAGGVLGCPELPSRGNLLIMHLDPGDNLDPSLVHRLESLSLLLRILVGDGADDVVALTVDDLVRMRSDDDLVHQHLGQRAPITSR